jgi:hypothetical protein
MDRQPRGKRKGTQLTYQYYLELLPYVNDSYWQGVINDIAYGKVPSFFTVINQYLLEYHKGGFKRSVTLDDDYPSSVSRLIDFMLQCGLAPPVTTSPMVNGPSSRELTWGKVSKRTQDALLFTFLRGLQKQYGLTNSEYRSTDSMLRMGLCNKSIGPDRIVINNNRIVQITDFTFDPNSRTFNLRVDNEANRSKSTKPKKPTSKVLKPWQKTIRTLAANHKAYQDTYQQLLLRGGIASLSQLHPTHEGSYEEDNEIDEIDDDEIDDEEDDYSDDDDTIEIDDTTDDF